MLKFIIIFFCLNCVLTVPARALGVSIIYPRTFMEQFCLAMQPDMDFGPVCVNWFHHAIKRCEDIGDGNKLVSLEFWTRISLFMFPESSTAVLSREIPIKTHPGYLTAQNCEFMFLYIVHDYVLMAPRYAIEVKTNAMLWQILYSLPGLFVLGSVIMAAHIGYDRQNKLLKEPAKEVFDPQTCLKVVAQRSFRMAKEEVPRLNVKKMFHPNEILSYDRSPVLTLKVNNKLRFRDSIITGSMHSNGRLFCLPEQFNEYREEFKAQSVRKALQFVGSDKTKLRLLIVFENEPVPQDVDDMMQKNKKSSRFISNLPLRTITPPLARKESPPKQTTPRSPRSAYTYVAGSGIPRMTGTPPIIRKKLRTGWSSSQVHEPLNPDEQEAIISVIRRNEEIENAERQRVGRLVERVEKIKSRAVESGPNRCRLCGDAFGLLRAQRIICEDCKKSVCPKCSLDISIRYHTVEKSKEIWLCRICSETREMWKKSGAWFFKGLPNYDVPTSTTSTPTRNISASTMATEALMAQRKALSCQTTPTRNVRVKKLTIRVCDSSSSEEEEEAKANDVIDGASNNLNLLTIETKSNKGSKCVSPVSDTSPSKLQRDDSFRMRTFGSIRSFIEGSGSERRVSNAFFFNNRSQSRSESNSHTEYDNISTASTVFTTASASNNRRESTNFSSNNRRSSVSSSWSISDSSSGTSGTTASLTAGNLSNQLHCRDTLLGWLEVSICYRENAHALDANVVRARDLPPMDPLGLTDPYCKLNIITAEGTAKYLRWQRTKCVHKTRNPEFNETLQFVGVEPEELGNALLYVAIFDEDKYGHDFLGAAKICLSSVHNTNLYRISVPLGPEDQYSNAAELAQDWPHGKMLISLCYNTKRRALTVNIKQCIELIPMDNNGSSDPFVKIQMKPDSHRNKKYKTSVKWRTLNPIFNEEFHFEAGPHDLNKQSLVLTVWDKDLGKSNDFLGSLVIGYNSKGERLQQWLDCIRLPDHYHEKWHCLAGDNPLH